MHPSGWGEDRALICVEGLSSLFPAGQPKALSHVAQEKSGCHTAVLVSDRISNGFSKSMSISKKSVLNVLFQDHKKSLTAAQLPASGNHSR